MKRKRTWIILLLLGGVIFWAKTKVDAAPQTVDDPGLEIPSGLVVPESLPES